MCDAQNDFIEDNGWFLQSKRIIYDREEKTEFYRTCQTLIDAARLSGVSVIYLCTTLRADRLDSAFSPKLDRAFRNQPFLVERTWGADIVSELEPEPQDIIVRKSGDSAFHFTVFHRVLKNLGADLIILVGGPLYRSVNATGRDAAAHGYTAFAVPDALYPIGFEKPELLRMRTHILSIKEALDRIGAARGSYEYDPAPTWRSLVPESCLLLVDLQNGFVRRDGFSAGFNEIVPELVFEESAYERLLENNAKLVSWARAAGVPVINVRTVNRADGADNAIYIDAQFSGKSVEAAVSKVIGTRNTPRKSLLQEWTFR